MMYVSLLLGNVNQCSYKCLMGILCLNHQDVCIHMACDGVIPLSSLWLMELSYIEKKKEM